MVIKVQKERGARDSWWFKQQAAQDEMLLTLHSPADAIIGQYHLVVLLRSPDGHILEKTDKIKFHLLFNPWCKGKRCKKCTHSLLCGFSIDPRTEVYQ